MKPDWNIVLAEFLLSNGKAHLTEESVMAAYETNDEKAVITKQLERFAELPQLNKLYLDIELPLSHILKQMEDNGIILDTARLTVVGEEISTEIVRLESVLKDTMGQDINLNSAIQVGNYLAEKEGVPLAKTKTGRYATNEQELSQHASQYPLIDQLLEYRELAKLRSTYVESLIDKVDEHGRVHTTYHQTAVNTGRLASTNPNMMNIPVTSVFGLKIKSCFMAEKGKTLLSFDYSQQELRILAHLANETTLIKAFNDKRDVHRITASNIFGVSYDEVTKEQRSAAKTINFGIIYGMSSYGLSQALRIPVENAQKFIDTFYETYPHIKSYYDQYLKDAKTNGYVETILGRRRNTFDFPGQKFVDNNQRRVLINYPIQGSAADLMKKAMVEVAHTVLPMFPEVKLLLQIHDDLVFEVPDKKETIDALIPAVKRVMCDVYPLAVPIEVDAKMGVRWGEMTEITD